MLIYLTNKLPKWARVFLKETIFKKILHRQLAEKVSLDSVQLHAEITRRKNSGDDGTTAGTTEDLKNIILYKKEAMRHFELISTPSEFQKGVIYPLLVGAVSFIAGFVLRSLL